MHIPLSGGISVVRISYHKSSNRSWKYPSTFKYVHHGNTAQNKSVSDFVTALLLTNSSFSVLQLHMEKRKLRAALSAWLDWAIKLVGPTVLWLTKIFLGGWCRTWEKGEYHLRNPLSFCWSSPSVAADTPPLENSCMRSSFRLHELHSAWDPDWLFCFFYFFYGVQVTASVPLWLSSNSLLGKWST